MKILMVSSYLPYPLFSGGHIRLYNLMENLKKNGHDITLICEKREHQTSSDTKEVLKVCEKVITVDRKKQWSIENILKAGFSLSSFLSSGHNLPQMRHEIESEILKEKYDLIHIETFYVFQNLPQTNIPTILVEHNIEYLVYKRYVDKSLIFIRPLLLIDVAKIKREEERAWEKASKIVTVSQAEKTVIDIPDVEIIPNGVDIEKFDIKRDRTGKRTGKVLFIGDFKWIQNIDSIQWILKHIWPQVLRSAKDNNLDLKLWVVGKSIPQSIKSLGDDSVIFDENAPSQTELIYQKADILLSPIRVGGGTSFKILESMASGLPVITTRLGAEGIGARDGKEIILANEPSEFADRIVEFIKDSDKYNSISANSKKFARDNFDWQDITRKLEKVYEDVLTIHNRQLKSEG